MSTDHQAQLLARWLQQEPGTAPPGELDDDAIETVYALRPARAPAARVSLDDILAEVHQGPLASTPSPHPDGPALDHLLARTGVDAAEPIDDDVMATVMALRPDLAPPHRVKVEDILAEVSTGPLARPPAQAASATAASSAAASSAAAPATRAPRTALAPTRRSVPTPRRRLPAWVLPALGGLAVAATATLFVLPRAQPALDAPSPLSASSRVADKQEAAVVSQATASAPPAPPARSAGATGPGGVSDGFAEKKAAGPTRADLADDPKGDLKDELIGDLKDEPAANIISVLEADASVATGASSAGANAAKLPPADLTAAQEPAEALLKEANEPEANKPEANREEGSRADSDDSYSDDSYSDDSYSDDSYSDDSRSTKRKSAVSRSRESGRGFGGGWFGGAGRASSADQAGAPMASTASSAPAAPAPAAQPMAAASRDADFAPAEISTSTLDYITTQGEEVGAARLEDAELEDAADDAELEDAADDAADDATADQTMAELRAAAWPVGGFPDVTIGRPDVAAIHAAATEADARGDDAGFVGALRSLLSHSSAAVAVDAGFRIARRQAAIGQSTAALTTIQAALARGGAGLQRARLYALAGQIYERLGQPSQAADAYRQAISQR